MAPHADFVFATASFEARGAPDEVIERLYQDHASFYEWGHITKLDRQLDNSDNGWYHQYVGFGRVVEHIDNQIQDHGPFDAAIGFSQGGQMLTALSMWYLYQRNECYWKCCLICSSTRVRDEVCVHSSNTLTARQSSYRFHRPILSARKTSTTTPAVSTPSCTPTTSLCLNMKVVIDSHPAINTLSSSG